MSISSSRYARKEPSGVVRRWLWRNANLFVLMPSWPGVGNSAEEVYFALLLAQQMRKRLLVLFPIQLPWPLHLPLLKAGVLDIISPTLLLRPGGVAILPMRIAVSMYFGAWRLLQILLKPIGIHVPARLAIPKFGQESLWCPKNSSHEFSWHEAEALGWGDWIDFKPEVRLPRRTKRKGTRALRVLGIDPGEWFVCLHVRDGAFYGDTEIAQPRNGSISAFEDAIRLIVSQGGKVVRMGGPEMPPAPQIKGLLDYATSGMASPRTDAFLMSQCRYFIGMQSGLYDLAPIFGKPRLIANMYNAIIGLPFRDGDAGFFKRMVSSKGELSWPRVLASSRFVLEELVGDDIIGLRSWEGEGQAEYVYKPDWTIAEVVYLERSPKEIATYAHAFSGYIENRDNRDFCCSIGPELVDAIRDFVEKARFSQDPVANVRAKYRIASRITQYLAQSISS